MNKRYRHFKTTILLLTIFLVQACTTTEHRVVKKDPLSEKRSEVINTAKSQIGVRYRPGGTSPDQGFDCSGLLQYSFSKAGVAIPRTTRGQADFFETTEKPKVGDVLFFKINKRNVSHSGIYLGNNKMLHAPSSGKRVEITDITEPYWQERFYKYGRSQI